MAISGFGNSKNSLNPGSLKDCLFNSMHRLQDKIHHANRHKYGCGVNRNCYLELHPEFEHFFDNSSYSHRMRKNNEILSFVLFYAIK